MTTCKHCGLSIHEVMGKWYDFGNVLPDSCVLEESRPHEPEIEVSRNTINPAERNDRWITALATNVDCLLDEVINARSTNQAKCQKMSKDSGKPVLFMGDDGNWYITEYLSPSIAIRYGIGEPSELAERD